MRINTKHIVILTSLLLLPLTDYAQRVAEVTGSYTYEVSENDDISLRQAKIKCVELAKAAAIKAEFGELITSDVIDSNVETNGESTTSYFWENTVAMAKGDWLGNTVPPVINIEYKNDRLVFTAEVQGKAREIVQSKTDIRWDIMKDGNGKRIVSNNFDSGERVYAKFRSPADGYVAVYLIVGDDETSCLLPYHRDDDGRYPVKGGKTYLFFDKEEDPDAVAYKMKTKLSQEDNQFVIIYSPHPFTKCNDISKGKLHPNSLNTHDFQKWLLRCQREDHDMVVSKKWIKILNKKM